MFQFLFSILSISYLASVVKIIFLLKDYICIFNSTFYMHKRCLVIWRHKKNGEFVFQCQRCSRWDMRECVRENHFACQVCVCVFPVLLSCDNAILSFCVVDFMHFFAARSAGLCVRSICWFSAKQLASLFWKKCIQYVFLVKLIISESILRPLNVCVLICFVLLVIKQ